MNQLYTTDTKPKQKKTTGWIIAGGAAVLIAVAAIFGNNLSGTRKSPVSDLADKLNEDRQVLRNDVVLHARFRKLQELDEKYTQLLMSSPSKAQLDSADYFIMVAENSMQTSLDSISTESAKMNAWANVVMSDSITAAFRKALVNRKYMASVRNAIEGKPISIKSSDKEMLQMQFDIQKKDERIASLEKELKAKAVASTHQVETVQVANAQTTANAKLTPANKAEVQKRNEALAADLKDEEMRNTGLLDLTRSLKAENEKLSGELSKMRSSNSSDDAAQTEVKNKMNSLQNQIDGLTADLNFSAIDCSLIRADGNKIISNSRQRKELLAQALKSLQIMAKSDNSSVQQRAKDKIAQLNQIASMVRD